MPDNATVAAVAGVEDAPAALVEEAVGHQRACHAALCPSHVLRRCAPWSGF